MEDKLVQEVLAKKNFGDLSDEFSRLERAKVVILPVPYGNTVTYRKGTEAAPGAVVGASCNMELFDEELGKDTYKIGIHTSDGLEARSLSPENMLKEVEKKTHEIISADKFPVILGGEHTVSIGGVKAAKKTNKDLSVLMLDAHHDLRDTYCDSKFNHACTARRISEIAPVCEVGTRSISKEERNFLPNSAISIFNVYDILDMPNWKEKIRDCLSDNVYISIDVDVFDPSIMPSVGTPCPGGLGWYETLDLLRYVVTNKNIVGFDVTELCPIEDVVGPDFMVAKLIYRLIGYIFFQNNRQK